MKNVAVILAGSGYRDGTEIREAVLSFLAIEKANMRFECFAKTEKQTSVTSHITGEMLHEERNILEESARIARGSVRNLSELEPKRFDALWLPGGNGLALNYSTFAEKGANCEVDEVLQRVIQTFFKEQKPIVAVCIAPALVSKALSQTNICVTLGTSAETNQAIEAMGNKSKSCNASDFVVDEAHHIFSTPAYMENSPTLVDIAKALDQIAEKIC